MYMMEMMDIRQHGTPFINTHLEEWIGPGLFLAFDRYSVDRQQTDALTRDELMAMVGADERHKLMGCTQEYVDSVAPVFIDAYLRFGVSGRLSTPAVLHAAGS